MKKRTLILGIEIALCAIVFYLANTAQFFGKFINHLVPCVQNPENSFPCYGVYDITIGVGAIIVGIFFAGVLLYGFLQHRYDMKRFLYPLLALIAVILIGIAIVGFRSGLPESWKIDRTTPESTEFAQKMQRYVVENMGQPIDSGFTAPLYLQAFSGLAEADFDSVETSEGAYAYTDGKLVFTRPQTGRMSTAEEAITENGHRTLFDALRRRLGSNLSVDEIITHITNDASPDFVSVGNILGAMTVVSVAPFNTGQYSNDPKMMNIGPRNIKIILKGPIEVTGVYSAVHSGIGFDGYCMSVSDAASVARLPILPVRGGQPDIHSSYFCFRNGETAQQQLGEESRTVTIEIDNYELNSYPAEVMDWVDLFDVVRE